MKRALAALVALTAVTTAAAASPPTKTPGELRVALSMPAAGFQVGAVRGRDVVLARGLEVDLARAIGKQLGAGRVVFVNEPLHSTLVSGGAKDWDMALGQITITAARAQRVDFSAPYLAADQGVLLRDGYPTRPSSLAALRPLQLCAERATTGAQLVVSTIKPTRKPRLLENPSRLSYELFTQKCDAVVFDAPSLAVLRRQAPGRYGPLVGRIATKESYAAAFQKGSALRAPVDAALARLKRAGTIEQLRKRWLGVDTSVLPVLR
jgi:ABC-type amino acid transport substrate-binding protein